jgi:hypothetical protein
MKFGLARCAMLFAMSRFGRTRSHVIVFRIQTPTQLCCHFQLTKALGSSAWGRPVSLRPPASSLDHGEAHPSPHRRICTHIRIRRISHIRQNSAPNVRGTRRRQHAARRTGAPHPQSRDAAITPPNAHAASFDIVNTWTHTHTRVCAQP